MKRMHRTIPSVLFLLTLVLGACDKSGVTKDKPQDSSNRGTAREEQEKKEGKLFGDIVLLGGKVNRDDGASGVGVNAFLWRAALDTVSFMPLASADPFGGVITTDWYTPPESPHQRSKVTIYILDTQLKADALKVTLNRQKRGKKDEWIDDAASPEQQTAIEDAILTRARQLRLN